MIAYNRTGLDNEAICGQVDEAMAAGCITEDERTGIKAAHPFHFYTPNVFICIGLFLLTILIAGCSIGLLLLVNESASGFIYGLLIFSGLACYGALEYIVKTRRHLKSGVDYALMWMSAGLLYTGLSLVVESLSITANCIVVIVLALWFTIRFANSIMALIVYGASLFLLIHIGSLLGNTVRMLFPFAIMGISIVCTLIFTRLRSNTRLRHYRQCLNALKAGALVSLYLAGNYFVVRQLGTYISGASESPAPLPMGWLFWILTILTPPMYILQGIRKKDSIYLWTGLALIAATIFTVRHYYTVLPAEWAMLIGGAIMIVVAYALTKYLTSPKHGFTSLEGNNKKLLQHLQIESLVIAETFGGAAAAPPPGNDFQFGGGSGGGGGAGGQY